ncbi:MAG: hypothetical protein HYS71_00150, partial [Candidatus Omnitrophica bacterium]|nr:hypothetical protein [Candidatus Omnitrophota bacterium]
MYDSSPLACGETRYGWNGCSSCGSPQSGPSRGTCSVSTASCTLSTCGQTLTGTDNCGSCSVTCGPCATAPYSFAIPGDPQYGFSYPRPETKDLVGLAAKGNIIIGDYTSRAFEQDVLKFLRPAGGDDRKTKPYVVDETDRPMGYDNAFSSEVCKPSDSYKGKTSPCFDGNYDQQDKENGVAAYKLNPDGTIARDDQGNTIPRKFYESSLTDEAFRTILDTNGNGRVDQGDDPIFNATTGGVAKIEAVLFTNHALAGQVFADTLQIDGAMIARDDGLSFGNKLLLNHDMRL